MNIYPVGVESFIADRHAKRQTDIPKLTVIFQNSATLLQ